MMDKTFLDELNVIEEDSGVGLQPLPFFWGEGDPKPTNLKPNFYAISSKELRLIGIGFTSKEQVVSDFEIAFSSEVIAITEISEETFLTDILNE